MDVERRTVNEKLRLLPEMPKTGISGKSLDFKAYSHTPERVDVGRRTVSDKLRLLAEMSVLDISTKSLDFKAYSHTQNSQQRN